MEVPLAGLSFLQQQSTMPAGLVGQLEDRQAFDLARFVVVITEGGKAELRRLKAAAGVAE